MHYCLKYIRLIAAEEAILTRQGSVLRLAGLYDERRGPHTFWLKNGTVQGSSDGFINLLHYDDAAEASIAAILNGMLCGDEANNIEKNMNCSHSRSSDVLVDIYQLVSAHFSVPAGDNSFVSHTQASWGVFTWCAMMPQ